MPVAGGKREKALTCTYALVKAAFPLVPPAGAGRVLRSVVRVAQRLPPP